MKEFEWQPPKTGPKGDNEVEVFCFALKEEPFAEESLQILQKLQVRDGFIGVYPNFPHGIAAIFKTRKQAQAAFEYCQRKSYKIGSGVTNCYVEKIFAGG